MSRLVELKWLDSTLKGDVNREYCQPINSLRPRRSGRNNADDIFKCIFLKENVWIPTIISLKFVPKGSINNIPALVQIMAWCHPGDKPSSEPMMASLLTHICVTRPQWVNRFGIWNSNLLLGVLKTKLPEVIFQFCWQQSLQSDRGSCYSYQCRICINTKITELLVELSQL